MVGIVAFLMTYAPVSSTYALSSSMLDKFASNDIFFYDPEGNCGGSSVGGNGVVTMLPGNNNKEKIWNWFASAGIAGVSDNASVIAGIIGNLQTESGFNPFVLNSSKCRGLYQACNNSEPTSSSSAGGRAWKLDQAFKKAGLDHLWGSSLSSVTTEENDTAIDVTLTELTTGDDGSFRSFVSHLSSVANTPDAYADLFLVLVERAVYYDGCGSGCQELVDPGAIALSNKKPYQGAVGRRNHAIEAFKELSGYQGDGSITRIQSDVRSVACSSDDYAPGMLIAGGMTLAEAREFMQSYRNISPRSYEDPGGSILNQWSINNLKPHSQGGDCLSDLENCVAFTQYFICQHAGVCMGLPNGGKVVDTLLASGKGFTNGGHTPRAYAVFSRQGGKYGHTGVILGVDVERGKVVIGEAGCGETIDFTNAKEKDLSTFSSSNYVYAYTDGLVGL